MQLVFIVNEFIFTEPENEIKASIHFSVEMPLLELIDVKCPPAMR